MRGNIATTSDEYSWAGGFTYLLRVSVADEDMWSVLQERELDDLTRCWEICRKKKKDVFFILFFYFRLIVQFSFYKKFEENVDTNRLTGTVLDFVMYCFASWFCKIDFVLLDTPKLLNVGLLIFFSSLLQFHYANKNYLPSTSIYGTIMTHY